jgi:hypothetical protein
MEMEAPKQRLGWTPGTAPSLEELNQMHRPATHPLGSMA